MGRGCIIVLIALYGFSLTHAFHTLVPDGKELHYDYKALVKAGTDSPASYASEFYLHGKLHVQAASTAVYARLSDLKYKVYNGEGTYGHDFHLHQLELPKESSDLLHPFKIVYNDNGQVKQIVTEQQEKVYARNMHKALAALLQMDVKKVNLNGDKPHAFTTDEYSIYGRAVAAYNVLPKNDKLIVQKMHDMKTTKFMYFAMVTNIHPEYCEAHYEEPFSHDSHQLYVIKKHSDHHMLDYVESSGGIYIYLFQAKSEAHFVYANVTLNLLEVTDISKAMHLSAEQVDNSLTYQIVDPSLEMVVPDITNGRRTVDLEKYFPIFEKMLDDLVIGLHENHIHMHQPDIQRGQLINRLVRSYTVFDYVTLEKMYDVLKTSTSEHSKQRLEVMHQLLPLVGTHASAKLIKKIIHEKKVEDEVALHMLNSMPFYLQTPTEKLLTELEDMLTWSSEVSVRVKNAAILSFASMIHRTFSIQKKIAFGIHHHHHNENHEETHYFEHVGFHVKETHCYTKSCKDVEEFIEKHPIYNKYVEEFATKMKTAEDLGTQVLYLQALYNTRLHSILKYLAPIVKGETTVHHNVRLTAIGVISTLINGDSNMVFEMFWPIFTDYNQDVSMRIAAYNSIMKSHPPISRLLNIHWEMQKEPDSEMYHYYYSYLLSMSHSTEPCNHVLALNLRQILKLTQKPNSYGVSSYFKTDYIDSKYKFGGDFEGFFVSTNSSKMFEFTVNSQMFNVPSNHYGLFVKIDGLQENALHLNLDSTTDLFDQNKVIDMIKTIPDMTNIHIYVIVSSNQYVVQTYYYDGGNVKDLNALFDIFRSNQFTNTKESITIAYDFYSEIMFPTDIGIPALVDIMMPIANHKKVDIKKEVTNNLINIHLDNHYHIQRNSRYGISFYNPVVDVWQGVGRYFSHDVMFPIYADVTINTQQHSVKVSLKRHQDEHKDVIGLRSHVSTLVYVKDELQHDVLSKSCSECKSFVVVTKGDHHRHNCTLYDVESYNTGYKYFATVYDSEMKYCREEFRKLISKVASRHYKNYWTPVEYTSLFLRNLYGLTVLLPAANTHGFLFKIAPSTENPVTQVDFTFRVNREYMQQKDEYLPGMKFNTRCTYTLKNKEKSIKTWDLNAIVDLNAGHTIRNAKVDVTRIIPGQKDFKICVEQVKKWTSDGVNGHMSIFMGQSSDGKCNKDDAEINVEMNGKQLDEQKTQYHEYEVCQPYSHGIGPDYHSMRCLAAHTSVRKYIYDIKTKNVPSEFKRYIDSLLLNYLKKLDLTNYHYSDEHNEHIADSDAKLIIEYDTNDHEADIEVITANSKEQFANVPLFWGHKLDNTHFSQLYMFMHYVGLVHTCDVYSNHVEYKQHLKTTRQTEVVPTEWTMYIGDLEKDAQHGVFLKKVEGSGMIALKVQHGPHSLEVYPEGDHGDKYKITVDGKPVHDSIDYHAEEWFSYMLRPHKHKVILTSLHFYNHIEYSGDHVFIQIPHIKGVQYHGHCIISHK